MNIVYHASDSFAKVTGTSIVSIFENNKDADDITVYIIENKFTDENKKKMRDLADKYARKIVFIPMPDINETEDLHLKKIKEKWIFDSYCRLFLDKLLPESVDRVLYLDGDVLNVGSLRELWNMDLEGSCAAAVIDCLGGKYYQLLGLSKEAKYCNSGVIFFDLVQWRRQAMGEKVRQYVHDKNGYVFFMEQTVFNAVMQGKIKILHPKYNTYSMMQTLSYEELMKLRKVERYYSKREIEEALINSVLVHMTSSFWVVNRPWCKVTNHPMKDAYKKYADLTPWDESLSEDCRGEMKKFTDFVVQYAPKAMVMSFASFLYNTVRVKQIGAKIKRYSRGEWNEKWTDKNY